MSDQPRVPVFHPSGGRKLTKQSHALATDINHIMERYVAHGMVPGDGKPFVYGDFSNSVSYHEAMQRVVQAQESFSRLPAHIRQYCHNDPGLFLDLVSDEQNRAELVKLGLLEDQAPPISVAPPAEPVDDGA